MERKIGEIFEFGGEWYQCVEDTEYISCINCCFYNGGFKLCTDEYMGDCAKEYRSDTKSICFKKLEKVGEPYMDGGKIMQKYKRVYREPIYFPYKELNCYNDLHGRICIEIRQKKEDMEEKDIKPYDKIFSKGTVSNTENLVTSSLKPFDLEAAKAGKPVCTRDGRKARIICFDAKGDKPIIALIEMGVAETPNNYPIDGKSILTKETPCDLMMLPEKKEGWVNVYKRENEYICENECNVSTGITVYKSESEAKRNIDKNKIYINTIKISWEE